VDHETHRGNFGEGRQGGLTIAMNAQWPFAMKDYEKLCGKVEPEDTASFLHLLVALEAGKEMIPESVRTP